MNKMIGLIEFSTRALNIKNLKTLGAVVKGDPFTRRLKSGKLIKVSGRYRKALRKQLVEEKAKQRLRSAGKMTEDNLSVANPLGPTTRMAYTIDQLLRDKKAGLLRESFFIAKDFKPDNSNIKANKGVGIVLRPITDSRGRPNLTRNRSTHFFTDDNRAYLDRRFHMKRQSGKRSKNNKWRARTTEEMRTLRKEKDIYGLKGNRFGIGKDTKARFEDVSIDYLGSNVRKVNRKLAKYRARQENLKLTKEGKAIRYRAKDFYQPRNTNTLT